MSIEFESHPGAYERQLKRRHENPLFPPTLRDIQLDELERARERDARDARDFEKQFQELLEEVSQLEASTGSERILALRQRVDMLYERAHTIAGDRTREKQALARLFDAINDTVRRAAGDDTLALTELAEEAAARTAHLAMLEIPLVADLLRPDPPFSRDELLPTLLSADEHSFRAVLGLFDSSQKRELLSLLHKAFPAGADASARVRERIDLLEAAIAADTDEQQGPSS
ncbi:MAG: hypothetical protein P8X48_06140 [Acidiferrobacteraceae bacterium]|jgi:cell division septum initiation protein DivIVA